MDRSSLAAADRRLAAAGGGADVAVPGDIAARPRLVLLVGAGGVGGAEHHTLALARLLRHDFDVVFVHVKADGRLRDGAIESARVECLGARRGIEPAAVRRLARLLDDVRADIVLCANPYPLIYAHAARRLAQRRYRIVEVYHTTVLGSLAGRLRMWACRPLFWLSDQLVFVCHAQRRYWLRRGLWARRVATIHNGVDTERFRPGAGEASALRRRLDFADPERPLVGLCAVFRPEKAHLHLLQAVARLAADGVRWNVLLIGDGPLRPQIEAAIERLGLAGQVRLTGYLLDVRPAVQACDLIALASTAVETFSIAALEAMAMAKPLVMSDIGGAREQVVDGDNGWLFPPGDVARLAECLRRAGGDRERLRRMGERSRAWVERDYSEQQMQLRYAALLRRLLPGSPA